MQKYVVCDGTKPINCWLGNEPPDAPGVPGFFWARRENRRVFECELWELRQYIKYIDAVFPDCCLQIKRLVPKRKCKCT